MDDSKALSKRESELSVKAKKYARASKSENTIRAYKSAWTDFMLFCFDNDLASLPSNPAAVIAYITFADQQKISTIEVKLAAIAEAHRMNHMPDPTVDEDVKTVMAGLRRELGTAPDKKSPVTRQNLVDMVSTLPDTLTGIRDRAILLLGFSGAFRRSELVAVRVEDLSWKKDMLIVSIPKSKTDQEKKGLVKNIPVMNDKAICPAHALKRWLDESGIKSGPVFRKVDRWGKISDKALGGQTVALIVKQSAERCGLDPDLFSGHSLRSGFVTAGYKANAPEWAMQKQTGHRSIVTLRSYNQDDGQGASDAARLILGD